MINNYQKEQIITTVNEGIWRDLEEMAAEEKQKKMLERYDANRIKAMDFYIESEEAYGPDHFITQISKMCCNLIFMLDETFKAQTAIGNAMGIMDKVLGLMDQSFADINSLMQNSFQNANYGFKEKRKFKRTQKQYIKNIGGRFSALSNQIQLITSIGKKIGPAVNKMTKSFAKQTKRMSLFGDNKKSFSIKGKKPDSDTPKSEFSNVVLQKAIDARRAEMHKGDGDKKISPSNLGTTSTSNPGVSPADGPSDISDIL